jgi:hypothetical protein
MTLLTPPAVFSLPSRFQIAPVANTQSGGRSPFDGTEQTLRQPGERWAAQLGWDGLTQAEWRPLLAFVVQLGGRAGRFLWSPAPLLPRRATGGVASGPAVNGGGQMGAALALAGFAASAQAFRAGDLLGFADTGGRPRLHMATADATASGGGGVTVAIAPPLRASPAHGTLVEIVAPTAIWALTADRNPMEVMQGLLAGGTLDIEEKIA